MTETPRDKKQGERKQAIRIMGTRGEIATKPKPVQEKEGQRKITKEKNI